MARRRSRKQRGVSLEAALLLVLLAGTGVFVWLAVSGRLPAISEPLRIASPAAGAGGKIAVFFAPRAESKPDGVDDALTALIRGAKKSVDTAFYDLEYLGAAEALIDRHRAGIPVRLVTDSEYAHRAALKRCREAGIPIEEDRRGAFMHNKFCVVDGRIVWTGSTNVTNNCLFRNNNNALRIESPALAENFALEFEEMFTERRFGKAGSRATPHPVLTVGTMTIECYFSPEDRVEREIISEIAAADRAIEFMAFSFTSKPIAEAMVERMRAGAAVRGIFEARNAGGPHSRDDFLRERGAEIRMDGNPHTMHHKVIIIDGRTVITGSYNFSKNASTDNDENCLILHDRAVAALYRGEFDRLWP